MLSLLKPRGLHALTLRIVYMASLSGVVTNASSGQPPSRTLQAPHPETSGCRRLTKVQGEEYKWNDVILCGEVMSAREHIIYFGGDVQDYPENMAAHRDNKKYVQWNLEETGSILRKRFPESAVFIVKPTRMHLNTFSVYYNFVESSLFGCPTHSPGNESWSHLYSLYHNILKSTSDDSRTAPETCPKQGCTKPLIFVGFSKGCIVLNQLLYDLNEAQNDRVLQNFVSQVKEYYWLDGGHCGGSNTWITSNDVLEKFAKIPAKIFVHVTPYQVKDENRNWIGKEERKFVDKLKKHGADISETLHFAEDLASIENHFRVLTVF